MTSKRILSIAKEIIRNAAILGLDEAGNRIAGPTAWRFIKIGLAPVVEELERRFPNLLEVRDDAEKAAEAFTLDVELQAMLLDGLSRLEGGQEQILAAIARQDDTLQEIGDRVDRGVAKVSGQIGQVGEQNQAAFNQVLQEVQAMKVEVLSVRELLGGGAAPPPEQPELSIDEIFSQANAYQTDAMKWIAARDAKTASQRLAQGRDLVEAGLNRDPDNSRLLTILGYIEKSQAQVSQMEGDIDLSVTILAEAAKYFTQALKKDPNISAINGLANIYYFAQDYDRAIQIGLLVVNLYPTYGAAVSDLSLALEGKLREVGPDPALVEFLKSVYRHLENLMPQQPQTFPASYLAYVQKRLAALDALPEQ
jgi:tetratricopeptide (TPR) repeat protein